MFLFPPCPAFFSSIVPQKLSFIPFALIFLPVSLSRTHSRVFQNAQILLTFSLFLNIFFTSYLSPCCALFCMFSLSLIHTCSFLFNSLLPFFPFNFPLSDCIFLKFIWFFNASLLPVLTDFLPTSPHLFLYSFRRSCETATQPRRNLSAQAAEHMNVN